MKTITSIKKFDNRARLYGLLLAPFALACFALSPQARATCQQGCDTSNANTFLGDDALVNNTTGTDNTATGATALHNNTTGTANTASGFSALFTNTEGVNNTAVGNSALFSNTTGDINTAIGAAALYFNTTGGSNTATGAGALEFNGNGSNNTATGDSALQFNISGFSNTATGVSALFNNTSGDYNTASGQQALDNNTTGGFNTADGSFALFSNTAGNRNTAAGFDALDSNTTGGGNTATGYQALANNTTGNHNIALGFQAGKHLTTGSHNIDVDSPGIADESNTIRIGKIDTHTATFIAGISWATVATGVGVIVDASGHLGTITSSARFKDSIQPMDKVSEAILALQPVTFRYKHDLDPKGIRQFGLVAEQVEKVDADLVAKDKDGKPYSVRYEAVNAMLLNEFLKEHRTVQELKSNAAKQEATITQQQKQIEALTAGLQKVSAQLELSKSVTQTATTNQ